MTDFVALSLQFPHESQEEQHLQNTTGMATTKQVPATSQKKLGSTFQTADTSPTPSTDTSRCRQSFALVSGATRPVFIAREKLQ